MPTYTKQLLSGSTNGKQIKLNTPGPGVTIHTATNVAGQLDEIWLWAYNDGPNTASVVILWGANSTDNEIIMNIPVQTGRLLVVDGMLANGGIVITAYGSVNNQIRIDGYVNNIAP